MKIYKPDLTTFLQELTGDKAYLVTTTELNDHYADHYIIVSGFNCDNNVLYYRWRIASHMRNFPEEHQKAVNKSLVAEESIKTEITLAGFTVLRGIIEPTKPLEGIPYTPKKKEVPV